MRAAVKEWANSIYITKHRCLKHNFESKKEEAEWEV